MTKVKKSTAKRQGKATAAAEKNSSKVSEITAERDGQERTFSGLTWDLLPPDKNGWKEVLDKPAEITSVPTKTEESETGSGSKEENSDLTDHIVTQEDLDTNPDLALSGTKVGDTIQIAKEGGTE